MNDPYCDALIGQMPAVTRLVESPWAAAVLLHEGFGINSHIVEVGDRLAGAGIATVIPALFWRSGTLQLPYSDVAAVAALAKRVDVVSLVSDIGRAVHWLKEATDLPAVTALGFCFGGAAAYVAATASVVERGVAWYPVRVPDYLESFAIGPNWQASAVPFLVHIADRDEFMDERVQSWIAAVEDLANVEVQHYDAAHGFFNSQRPDLYDPIAAAGSWESTLAFLGPSNWLADT